MKDFAKIGAHSARWQRYAWVLVIVWTVVVAGSLLWNVVQIKEHSLETARIQARSAFKKDIVYRRWNAIHGGVYAPVTEKTQPNPYLDVPEREIITPSGKMYTLINPAYMTRQMYELAEEEYGIYGDITSLDPIRPENAADIWETQALQAFERGETETSSVEEMKGQEYMRLMSPLITEKSCLKCHAAQGYQEGDIRGGISVSVPMAPLLVTMNSGIFVLTTGHSLLWLMGLLGIVLGTRRLTRSDLERKQAEEALRESEENFRHSLDNSPLGTRIINAEGETIYANQAILDIYGYSSIEELESIPASERHTPRSYAERQERVRKRGAGEPVPDRFEQSIIRKNGEVRDLEVFNQEVLWGGEKQFQLIYHDITERKQAEEREKEMQKELNLASRLASVGELAAGVAHEINNPLTGILAFSERLLRKSTDEKASRDLKRINNEANRAARVVERLLTFARRREPEKEYLNINSVVRKALELRAYELKTGNIKVELDLAVGLPRVMVDSHQFQEVFLSIIMNAEQAITEADRGGKLSIKTQPMKDYIRISFTDDGPGFPAEQLEKIFDPFFTTRGKEGGTGLGLSVCYGIVGRHDGRIYAKSKPGKGATFIVELPLTGEKVKEAKRS